MSAITHAKQGTSRCCGGFAWVTARQLAWRILGWDPARHFLRMQLDQGVYIPCRFVVWAMLLGRGNEVSWLGSMAGGPHISTCVASPVAEPLPLHATCAQVRRDRRHVAKWRRMLGSSAADFEAYCKEKRQKVKRRVRKGIPDEFRGYVWQLLSGKQ